MRSRIFSLLLVVVVAIVLVACGTPSKENVTKKLSDKWNDSKGYELQATMEIKTGSEPRLYDVDVWHTKPDFYRVHVTQNGKEESQMIVRNEDGVFVVTPSLGKTYKFQSDWPAQNSQAYLIGALSEDIKADKNATMTEEDDAFVFETETRNNHRKVLPSQKIYINKKTWLPIYVSVLDENKEEQIRITFNKITLGTARDAKEYAVELNNEESKPAEDEADDEAAKEDGFETYYPTVNWQGVTLEIEEAIKTENGTRSFMTFGGEKEFTIVQERVQRPEHKLPVSIEGDPVDLGFAVAAITDKSIRWESDGISFFIASETLTKDELIDVALSMSVDEMK
ncbi:LolA family protein [Sporosarcina jiandibaonis]|uniref:LolA family protein n=1 Tax=Sporosarcina jiandibaonis TaxID=2715535 RepID=UPI001551D10E|nr:outer membrane lipoprotein carrier protein LolA [Sporosarcina jiandibaonis]